MNIRNRYVIPECERNRPAFEAQGLAESTTVRAANMPTVRAYVKSLQPSGFVRLGRRWPGAGVEVDIAEDELRTLQAEPMLSVAVVQKEDSDAHS
jgi:hypothetical protein